MESKNELKESDLKNHTCYYFDDTTRVYLIDINFSDILLNKKPYKNMININHIEIWYNFNFWHIIQNCYGCETTAYLVW